MISVEKKPARTSWLAVALILALSILNLLLIKQNFDLRKQLSSGGRIDASATALKPGEVLAMPIAGTDLKGQPYLMNYGTDKRRHLLLFFSPSCTYCIQQAPLWANVLNQIDSSRFEVVGLVGDREDKQKVASHADGLGYFKTRLVMPVISIGDEMLARYKLTATPTTILIDNTGKVEHAWVGKWDKAKIDAVAAALNIKLDVSN